MFKYVKDLSTLNEKTLKKNIFCKQIEQSDLKNICFICPFIFLSIYFVAIIFILSFPR